MSRRGWALFAAMGLIWGTPYLLIKVAVEDLPPTTLVMVRTGLATLLLLPLALTRDQLRPLAGHGRPLVAFAAIEMCLPWLLLAHAERSLSSSLTGLLVAAVPLVGAALVKLTGHEPMGLRRIAGLLVGFAGVAALVGFDVETSSPGAVAAVGGVAVCYALGPFILARRLAHLPSLGVVTAALAISFLVYLPVGSLQWPHRAPGTDTWLAVLGLAVLCTAVAFVVFFALIAEAGPARATVITYVNPVVAVLLGVAVLGERVTVATGVGFALILAGSVLATSRERPGVPAAVPAAVPAGGPPRAPDGFTGVDTDLAAACPVPEP